MQLPSGEVAMGEGWGATTLLDLLESLPLDVVDDNVWEQLPTATDCGSLRQACQQSRRLTDLLVTAAVHDVQRFCTQAGVAPPPPPARGRAAYLARLPRLTSLELQNLPNEGVLASLLTHYGTATQGRVTRLTLSGSPGNPAPMSAATGCAVRLACPRLEELSVALPGGAGSILHADFLLPLSDMPLISLTLQLSCTVADDALLSLRNLSHLQIFSLACPTVPSLVLRSLSALTNLTSCTLRQASAFSSSDLSSLLHLTQLVDLDVSEARVQRDGTVLLAMPSGPAAALLNSMTALRRLALGTSFVVDDNTWPALRRMTRLLTLEVGSFQVTSTASGHLPALKTLEVASSRRPAQLLRALLPLLPLSCLEHVNTSREPAALRFDVGGAGAASVTRHVAALAQAVGHLAAAPRLQPHVVHVACAADESPPTAVQIASTLHPIGGRVSKLLLSLPAVGAEWAALACFLPDLLCLSLSGCRLSDAALGAICVGWPVLQDLHVLQCTGITVEGWLGLAAARRAWLWVHTSPPLPADWVVRCREVQELSWGGASITWEDEVP